MVNVELIIMKWPATKEDHAYMKMRQVQNKHRCFRNPNENWMKDKLEATDFKWKRQSQWGYRIFDFWNAYLGIAIEVDGDSHDPEYDRVRDDHNYKNSGIVVLRVRNKNDEDAERALAYVATSETWNERRTRLGHRPITNLKPPKNRPEGKARKDVKAVQSGTLIPQARSAETCERKE